MQISFCQALLTGAIVLNLVILYFISQAQQQMMGKRHVQGKGLKNAVYSVSILEDSAVARRISENKNIGDLGGSLQNPYVTVVLREFEDFENYIGDVAQSFQHHLPKLPFLVIADTLPYPPLTLPDNAHLMVLSPSPEKPPHTYRPENHVQSEFVLLVPDGVELQHWRQLKTLIQGLKAEGDGPVRLVAAPVLTRTAVQCLHLQVNLKEWTATYSLAASESGGNVCTALHGDAVVLIRAKDLFNLSFPIARPVLSALFIQTSLRGWKVKLMDGLLFTASHRPLFSSAHNQWKADHHLKEVTSQLMRSFGLKRLAWPDGRDQWFGCSKETSRCFGTVHDDTPEYLYLDRWTPPCCLRALRETTKHVIAILESSGVRYWLEGGSLLGAARYQDIIPWDYDVDLGIYLEDVPNCEYLKNLNSGSLVDANGYVWERAVEGDFYRIQYSELNHLHVDLWPFYSRDGVMTKDTWTGHKQDVEFPEHFLQPLVPMLFAGITAYGPNNHRAFLELKFGQGVIENPQYPNPNKKRLVKRRSV
ncbi:Fukutin-related protein [Bagarius yarrelli]|uniref:Ribitol-5-phosphate transferase n=1 Tax=Bagarius yarrelli TaxID=175774 RepID=A0A556V8F5_BAGYA|nr:Fukutin-related protein [Bagarius yarrelli]